MYVLAIFVVVVLFLAIVRVYPSEFYRKVGALALTLHVLVSVLVLRSIPYNWDIAGYDQLATAITTGHVPANAGVTSLSYATWEALLYAVFGGDVISVSIVNGLLAVAVPILLGSIVKRLYPRIESIDGVYVVSLFLPLPFLFLTLPMRDSVSVLLFFGVVALSLRVFSNLDRYCLLLIPLFPLLRLLRPELAATCGAAFVAALLVEGIDRSSRTEISLRSLACLAFPFALTGAYYFFSTSLARIETRRAYRATGGAGYLIGMEYSSPLDVLLSMPVRALYFQFAPFPLHAQNLFAVVAQISLPILIVLSTAAVRSLKDCRWDRTAGTFLIVVYLFGTLGYGLIDSNFGTTVRHRTPFVFLLLVFAAPVVQGWMASLRRRAGEFPRHDEHDRKEGQKAQELHARVQRREEQLDDAS